MEVQNKNGRPAYRVAVVLNDRSFEYDVYTLVIAFYQGAEVHVYDDIRSARMGSDPDLILAVDLQQENISVSCMETGKGGKKSEGEKTGRPDRREQGPLTSGRKRKITEAEGADQEKRLERKNSLKRKVYAVLSERTGRNLPWGDLTGIRPVKLAMEFLKKEESGKEKEESEKEKESSVRKRTEDDMIRAFGVSPEKAALAVEIAGREQRILRLVRPEEGYSLYIGIPFCPSICLYCSFSSGTIGTWQKETDRYVDTLIYEIRACGRKAERPCFPDRRLQTVYIGGGTPTSLSAGQLDRLLDELEDNFDMDSVLEFTVEAGRPDTITEEKLAVLKKHRVSRISVNPQTMNQKTLDLIGRRHTVQQTVSAFYLARSMGFDCINMDLIVGLPGEGPEEVARTMKELEKLDPDDITVHALALKRAARLALHMDEYESVSFRASDTIMAETEKTCRRLGMTPYYLYRQKNIAGNFENAGYAKAGKACLYNILIMEEVQSILALGASGSTKVICPGGRIERIENVKDVRSYLDRIDEMIGRKDPIRQVKGSAGRSGAS